MNSVRYFASFLLIAALAIPLSAQVTHPSGLGYCGTEGKSPWLERYQDGEFPVIEKSNEVRYVPLNVVFLGDDNNTGFINPVKFLNSMELLNSDFRDQNIQFFISGQIKYLANSGYNDHNLERGRQMMIRNNIRNHVNTYVVANPNGNCGYYLGGDADAVALGANCLGFGDRTWSHEIGHYLSLPHTFYGWESVEEIENIDLNEEAPETVFYRGRNVPVEKVDGSNCTTAADGFCDTSPDYLMQRWSCTGTGIYRDSLLDPDSVRFAVPASNIMSYALDNCVNTFTPEQKDAMFANLDSRTGLVSTATPSLEGADPEDQVLLLPEDRARLLYEDSVTLIWNKVENADFYVVELNKTSNFGGAIFFSTVVNDTSLTILEGLQRRTDYYWRVRPVNNYVVGGGFSDVFRFRNGNQLVSTIDEQLNAAVTIAPNPVSGGQQLRISARDLSMSGELQYQLIDASGRVIRSREGLRVSGRSFSEELSTANLSAGIYFVRLRLNDRMISRRIVVTP